MLAVFQYLNPKPYNLYAYSLYRNGGGSQMSVFTI